MPKVYKILLIITVSFTIVVLADNEDEEAFPENEVFRQEQVHYILNTVKETQLLNILYLTPEEEEQFLDAYRKLEDMRIKYRKEKIEIMGELQKDLAAGDVWAVSASLDSLEANDGNVAADIKNLRTQIRGLLQDEQYAKFVLFETNFEKKLRRLVMENRPADLKNAYLEGELPAGGADPPSTETTDRE